MAPKGSLYTFITVKMALTAFLLIASLNTGWADQTTRIVVVPFGVNAPEALSYIKRGINDMLTSRLEKDRKVIVLTAGDNQDDLKILSQKTNADYLITGSVTIMGDSVSTDAQVVKGSALDTPVLSFSRTGGKQSDLIGHINELADTINVRVLGNQPEQVVQQAPTAVPVAEMPSAEVAVPAVPTPSTTSAHASPTAPRSDTNDLTRIPGTGTIEGEASGITAGDVNGDGVTDMITITKDRLFVHRFAKGRWVKFAEHSSLGDFIGVDAADINRNGKQEIFVTRFSQVENKVYSFVLEWDGKNLQRIASQLPWYFRNVDIQNQGLVLVGQRQTHANRFSSGINKIQWTGDEYTMAESLPLPATLNVFGFAQGAVRTPDKAEVVRYNSDGYIEILNAAGEENWVSTEHYGGGTNVIVFIDQAQWDTQDYVYLPPRILLHDMDNDGIQEMLVVNNQKSFTGSGVLERHRFYSKGRLEWLKWQNEGIRAIGKTLDMARFIADFTLLDVDGDQKLDVVAAIVQKTDGMATKGSSFLASAPIH